MKQTKKLVKCCTKHGGIRWEKSKKKILWKRKKQWKYATNGWTQLINQVKLSTKLKLSSVGWGIILIDEVIIRNMSVKKYTNYVVHCIFTQTFISSKIYLHKNELRNAKGNFNFSTNSLGAKRRYFFVCFIFM